MLYLIFLVFIKLVVEPFFLKILRDQKYKTLNTFKGFR